MGKDVIKSISIQNFHIDYTFYEDYDRFHCKNDICSVSCPCYSSSNSHGLQCKFDEFMHVKKKVKMITAVETKYPQLFTFFILDASKMK